MKNDDLRLIPIIRFSIDKKRKFELIYFCNSHFRLSYLCIEGQSNLNGRQYAIWGTHGWWWIMVCHLKSVQPRTEVAERLAICWIFFLKYLATRPSSIFLVSNCWSSIPMDIWHMFVSRSSYFFQVHLC